MITRIDHIGVAVDGLAKRLPFWSEVLGLSVEGVETVESEQVKVAFLPVDRSRVELLEPTGEQSAIARHIAKRGEGLHHLTFEVDDLDEMLERMKEHGVQVVGDGARVGAGGQRVAFVHPRSTGGVLVELVEAAADAAGAWDEELIAPGAAVLVYLRDPQEKIWGVLRRLEGSGVVVEGIDLSSFDDWLAQIERGEDSVVGPSVLYLPIVRVEKILLDRSTGDLPSLAERFERRIGRTVQQVVSEIQGKR
jgi:methylmalonyl-CoA/ethylmalonyl-CoA epimerase